MTGSWAERCPEGGFGDDDEALAEVDRSEEVWVLHDVGELGGFIEDEVSGAVDFTKPVLVSEVTFEVGLQKNVTSLSSFNCVSMEASSSTRETTDKRTSCGGRWVH